MNIINLSVPAGVSSPVAECGAVMIGYVGEGGVTQVVLDFSAWAQAYGDGVVTLGVQRSGDPTWYPVVLDVDGTSAAWLVSKTDTNVEGMGVARFAYTVGGAEKRSAVWQFFVDRGLQSPEGDAPDPYESWVETLTELGAETLQNAQDAREAAEAAEQSATDAAGSAESAETAKNAAGAAAAAAGESARAAGENAATAQGAAQAAQNAAGAAEQSATDAEAAQQAAETAVTHYPKIVNDYWWVWDAERMEYVNTGVKAKGEGGEGAVSSVNGKTGAVTLDAEDVGALPDSSTLDDIPDGSTYKRPTAAQVQQISTNAAAIALKQATINASGILKGSGNGQVSAAVAGTDYLAPDALAPYRTAAAQDVIDEAQNAEIADLKSAVDTKAPVIIDTASGSVASFPDGADGLPLKTLVVNIEPMQAGSGDPSPENVRPISGWTGCEVTRAGKNLLDINAVTSGAVDPDTGEVIHNTSNKVTPLIKCEPNTTYVLSGFSNGVRPRYYKSSVEYIGEASSVTLSIFTTPANCYFMRLQGANSAWRNAVNPQLELGSTATGYEPYVGTTLPITFPTEAGTVYGGTLTVNADGTGELRKRPYYASYNGETLVGPWLSSMDVYAEDTTPTIGAQVVDLGGEETVYQLTDLQVINTFCGTNNIWADCGDVEVTYRADTKLFVEQQSGSAAVNDVQVNGTSIVQSGVANIPMASASTPGVVISGNVTVTGTTPTINALPGVRYVCGEVATLDITLPESGIVDVTFESGSTATVLTITPPTGVTLKWANGFDPTSLEAGTTYEINIADGLGVAAAWT